VRAAAVLGNYDYLYDWVFLSNGSIQVRVGATGIAEVKVMNQTSARDGGAEPADAHGPYRVDERYAAGLHPTLSEPGKGLPEWTKANRDIAATDIVVWYTVGMHHVVRGEDWPVMPVARHSFELGPFDFFDHNPAVDLPEAP
jgi:Cu2+-containing amine oxidase